MFLSNRSLTPQSVQLMAADNLQRLEQFLRPLCPGGIALAFSGGVDSSLLLALLVKMQREEKFSLLVLSALSTLQSARDLAEINAVAAGYGVEVHFVNCDVLAIAEVKHNAPLRCYHCKKFLFETMLAKAAEQGVSTLLEGTHADDLKSYRPGRRALAELGVRSPLAELGISKSEVRAMAKALHVKTAERPSSPCLATRFDYGTELTEEKLRMAGEGERVLRELLPDDADLRLRIHGKLGRIEVNDRYFSLVLSQRHRVIQELEKLGFERITLDIAGFYSGSFDRQQKKEM